MTIISESKEIQRESMIFLWYMLFIEQKQKLLPFVKCMFIGILSRIKKHTFLEQNIFKYVL